MELLRYLKAPVKYSFSYYRGSFFLIVMVFGLSSYGNDRYANRDSTIIPVTLYLTFDDGPITASKYLDSLSRADSAKMTVFLIGKNVFASSQAKKIFDDYKKNPLIEIGNHSFTHANKKYKEYYRNPTGVTNDIITNRDTLRLEDRVARLPGRNSWRIGKKRRDDLADVTPAADSLYKSGYSLFGWDLEWQYDSLNQCFYTAEQMIKAIHKMSYCKKSFTANHIVILCHDPMLEDACFRAELEKLVTYMRLGNPFIFEQLCNYPQKTD